MLHRPRLGFTLVELMVVLILMVILLGFGAVLFMNLFRRSELDQAGIILRSQLNNARIQAVKTRRPHFLAFRRRDEDVDGTGPGTVTRPVLYTWIYEDTTNAYANAGNFPNAWDDANRHWGNAPSRRVEGTAMQLPMGLQMHSTNTAGNIGDPGYANFFVLFHPTGRAFYPAGHPFVAQSAFDSWHATIAATSGGGTNTFSGDLILRNAEGNKLCLDVDEGMGRVRKLVFVRALGN